MLLFHITLHNISLRLVLYILKTLLINCLLFKYELALYFLDFDSYFLSILHFLLDVKFLNLNTLVTKDIYFYHLTNWDNIIIIIIYYREY